MHPRKLLTSSHSNTSHMLTTEPLRHHIWIGTWTSSLIDTLDLAINPSTILPTLRKQILALGDILTKGLVQLSRLRGTQPPYPAFVEAIETRTSLHSLYPTNILQTIARRQRQSLRRHVYFNPSINREQHNHTSLPLLTHRNPNHPNPSSQPFPPTSSSSSMNRSGIG